MLSGKRIILGVTAGIAAYKAAFLLRAFQKAGAEVRVTMTDAAQKFVGRETFSSLSGHPVATDIFPEESSSDSWTRHIEWGEWADLYVIAPCTANSLGKIAGGLSDNMLTATVLAARCPVLICPTMDGEMYEAPAVKRNLQRLQDDGYHILEPDSGYLASGLQGKGRLPETDAILEKSRQILKKRPKSGPLSGKKVLVTAGPTREHLDPVRFISNPSSGKMGFAMAAAARDLGAEVTVIHGAVTVPPPKNMATVSITSAAELFEEVKKRADADIIIMAAAVADFTPAKKTRQKIKKKDNQSSIAFDRTTDILAWLGEHKKEQQTLIGFAMETEELIERAKAKREQKQIDWILANSIAHDYSGFATDNNTITLLGKAAEKQFTGPKKRIARQILDHIFGNSTVQ